MSQTQIGFGQWTADAADWSISEFLESLSWSPTVSADIRTAAANGNCHKLWRTWSRFVAGRGDRRARRERFARHATTWPWNDRRQHPAAQVLPLIEQQAWPRLSRWASSDLNNEHAWRDERTEHELLAIAELLWSDWRVPSEVAWPVWRWTLTRALELCDYLSKPLTCELSLDRRLFATGELPWLLGQLFADVDGVTEFRQLGQQSLRTELIELSDSDGTPAASLLPVLPRWLASLTRSVEVGAIVGDSLLEGETKFRFEDLVAKSVMLLDRDGEMLGAAVDRARRTARRGTRGVGSVVAMLHRAAELAGLDRLSLAAESLRFRRHVAQGGSGKKFHSETFAESAEERLIVTDTDLPATQSDWAGWACLRNWWHPAANTAVVIHDSPGVRLQVSLHGLPVIAGDWGLQVNVAGQPLSWNTPWTCSCWSSDPDMDYLELQRDLPDGPMLCRQIFLSRKDDFLVLADAVTGVGSRRIDLTSTLPLSNSVRGKSDVQTREVRFGNSTVKARCFPLALPDDRLHGTSGRLEVSANSLSLTQAASGESIYAPLVLDWSPQRTKLAAEWRSLTVTEMSHKLSVWQAAGFRLRVGNLHLVVYRSLQTSEESRAVLGLHTNKESVIALFNNQGEVMPLVSVEG